MRFLSFVSDEMGDLPVLWNKTSPKQKKKGLPKSERQPLLGDNEALLEFEKPFTTHMISEFGSSSCQGAPSKTCAKHEKERSYHIQPVNKIKTGRRGCRNAQER